jgi:hypothetical protein
VDFRFTSSLKLLDICGLSIHRFRRIPPKRRPLLCYGWQDDDFNGRLHGRTKLMVCRLDAFGQKNDAELIGNGGAGPACVRYRVWADRDVEGESGSTISNSLVSVRHIPLDNPLSFKEKDLMYKSKKLKVDPLVHGTN